MFHGSSLLASLSLLVLLAAGCATVQQATRSPDRAELLLVDRDPPRDGCTVDMGAVPPLSALADSAALHAAVRAVSVDWRIAGDSAYVVYGVGDRDSRAKERIDDVAWWLPRDGEPELRQAVLRHLNADWDGPANVRLRIDFAEGEPSFRVGHSEICPPVGLARIRVRRRAMSNAAGSLVSARVSVTVTAEGMPADVRILRSTGDRELDDFILQTIRSREYSPGLIDRVPATMTDEATIDVQDR